MGIVYLAEDTRLHRKVALKFLPPAVALDEHARARFMREAEAASTLDHPNIATIYEIGDWEQQLFIAMAFYEGEILKTRIERGPMALGEAASVVEQLAAGLTAAHAAGIIHRDLKPANIMLRPDGQVKILDFGLAKLLTRNATTTRMTSVGTTVGTVAYMSPEQARGEEVDAATDVWALGVMLYEMLAGRLPFQGGHAVAVMSSALNDTPPPIKRAHDDVPSEFKEILAAALVKDRSARTLTASQVVASVAAYRTRVASSERVVAASPAARPIAKNRLAIAALTLLVITALGGGAWAVKKNADIRWATDVALPVINRLVEHDEPVRAFELGRQAQRYIPTSEMLAKLMTFVTRNVSIDTAPSGAEVSYRDYGRNDSGWTDLGKTPLRNRPVPRGWLRWRLEKNGFAAVEDVDRSADQLKYRLDAIDAVPQGMVRVSSAGSPFSIFIPGLDHLPEVQLDDYWIDRYEVTNGAFKKFVDDGGYERREFWNQPFEKDGRVVPWEEGIVLFRDTTGRAGPAAWELGTYPAGQGDYPVTGVSWYEAAAYAEYVRKALPTVYHWSRVGSQQFSAAIVPRSNFAGRGPSRVGASSGMSRFGAYDMAGNVKEWSWNLAGAGKRYILGGAWNEPVYMFTDADARSPFDREATFGFRCVKLGADRLASTITGPIEFPSRDYANEKPVSNEMFNVYRSLYSYDKTDLRSKVESVVRREDSREERVSLDAAYGNERMTVYLFLPKAGTPPYQAVVFFPGSNALRERLFDARHARYFEYIVTSGRALVLPVFKSTYDRGDGLLSDYPNTTSVWRDHVIMWSKDLGRTLDYLHARPDIAHDKIAFMGVSWGAQMGAILPAVEPRLKAVLLIVGGFNLQKALPEVEPINFAPHIAAPTLMLNGKYDFFYPTETSQVPMFRFLGAPPDRKRRVVYETGHSIPRNELIKETLDWLDQYLGAVGRKP
jgi:dienelactone hydrolase